MLMFRFIALTSIAVAGESFARNAAHIEKMALQAAAAESDAKAEADATTEAQEKAEAAAKVAEEAVDPTDTPLDSLMIGHGGIRRFAPGRNPANTAPPVSLENLYLPTRSPGDPISGNAPTTAYHDVTSLAEVKAHKAAASSVVDSTGHAASLPGPQMSEKMDHLEAATSFVQVGEEKHHQQAMAPDDELDEIESPDFLELKEVKHRHELEPELDAIEIDSPAFVELSAVKHHVAKHAAKQAAEAAAKAAAAGADTLLDLPIIGSFLEVGEVKHHSVAEEAKALQGKVRTLEAKNAALEKEVSTLRAHLQQIHSLAGKSLV